MKDRVREFKCQKCGHCCRVFGNISNCLPLWEWEVNRLKELAKQKRISFNVKPVDLVFDKRTNLAVCVHYWLDAPCPFLINNECSIYEKRPLVCKGFPMVNNPFFSGKTFDLNIGDCNAFTFDEFKLAIKGNIENTITQLPKQEIAEKYKKFFGEEIFINSFIIEQIKAYIDMMMKDLIQNKKVKLRKISKLDYKKHNPIPFFEFLKLKGIMTTEEKIETIEFLINYNKIKEKLIEK